jgi:hypothetical protein
MNLSHTSKEMYLAATITPSDDPISKTSHLFCNLLEQIRQNLTEDVGGFPELTYTLSMHHFTLRMPSRFLNDTVDTGQFSVSHDTASAYVTISHGDAGDHSAPSNTIIL